MAAHGSFDFGGKEEQWAAQRPEGNFVFVHQPEGLDMPHVHAHAGALHVVDGDVGGFFFVPVELVVTVAGGVGAGDGVAEEVPGGLAGHEEPTQGVFAPDGGVAVEGVVVLPVGVGGVKGRGRASEELEAVHFAGIAFFETSCSKHKKISTGVFEYLGAAQNCLGEHRSHQEMIFLEVKNVGGGDAVKGGKEVVAPAAIFAQRDVFYWAVVNADAVGEEVNSEGAVRPKFGP